MKNKAVLLLAATYLILEIEYLFFIAIDNVYISFGIPPLIWLVGGIYIWKQLKKHNMEYSFYEEGKLNKRDVLIFFFTFMGGVAFAVKGYCYGEVKPLLFSGEYFSGNVLYTIRNFVYYPSEVLLMLELVLCGQKTGEVLTKKKDIPFGAIVLFVLWGLPHSIVHGWEDGMISAFMAFVYVIPFYVSGRKFKTSYISMLILCMLG